MAKAAPEQPLAQLLPLEAPDDLRPRNGRLFVVRWWRLDGQVAKARYYRRRCDAERFHERLARGRWSARVYETDTTWRPVSSRT